MPAVPESLRLEARDFARGLNAAAASVAFGSGPLAGGLSLAALCLAPRFALSALLGTAAAWLAGRALAFERARLADGELLRNALLTALAAAWISVYWQWLPAKWVWFAAAAGVLGLMAAAACEHLLANLARLPVLSSGFVLAASVLWTIHGGERLGDPAVVTAATLVPEPAWLPHGPLVLLRTLGLVFFLPHATVGAVLALAILSRSRLIAAAALCGWLGGAAANRALVYLAPWLPDAGVFLYNSLLAGIAFGACFYIPSPRSLALAAAAGATAAVVWQATAATAASGSPARLLAGTFLVTTWAGLAALRQRQHPAGLHPSPTPWARPEDVLRRHRERMLRDPDPELPVLAPPFDGERVVTQGFDGPHTHRGPWRHGLDFEIRDAEGHAAPPGARSLDDYYTHRSQVLAPAAGWVARVEDEVEDNLPGHHNLGQNWGNHLVLRTTTGRHLLLAHFLRRGLAVVPGQYVETGQLLGYCGNSGRSPLPHLHLQCQSSAEPGSPTVPFLLGAHTEQLDGHRLWRASGVPAEGARIARFTADPWAARLFQSWRTGRRRFRFTAPGGGSRTLTLETRFTDDGRWEFRVPAQRASCLGSVEGASLCLRDHQGPPDGMLGWWWIALARVPFTRDTGLEWSCRLPAGYGGPRGWAGRRPATLETRSRLLALHGDADRLSSVEMRIDLEREGSHAGSIEARFSLFRGITRLLARTPRGDWLVEELPESEPAPNQAPT